MRLTRRDALAALTAAGVTVGGGALFLSTGEPESTADGTAEHRLDESTVRTLVAAAEVLYPSEVEGTEEFVTSYVQGKVEERPDHGRGIADAVDYLDDYAVAWYDAKFADLVPSDRDEALERMNADTAAPDPNGSDVERVRYFVVNELLYGLYTTPTGTTLVGLENPRGHPGGLASYQRGPQS
ncbi:Gluconate 2-dehydrogenase, subunit 3 [Halanaeroarchaeum sp. HSR-CO]|uniref:gluconate 2-dehydrogenase subunit 3 family protein n=1 Tax=Halanaeroarchaeum sp. HSR-CO TaxID=2866382 RepID=UPI00217D76A2|nr:gluconate 2-dehydrogenase subunit 3 family protein [Halanaeroarchaeum sp. HSR-CO]UWG47857.1 Gluconate 2-dehydrogenase, subunit 3 [Halanaeroarchaeum sp. HSR-CO]